MNHTPTVTVIILTFNEQMHLERCIQSCLPFAQEILVIDSFSTDQTLAIAERLGAKVYQNPFVNQAIQFQWALDNCPTTGDWLMRMDADEYVTPELATEILTRLAAVPNDTTGIFLKRQVHFMGRWIRHGGYYPTKLLRIWRTGIGSIEQRWMDEHIRLSEGKSLEFQYDIIDDNLQNLTWWTQKHNSYATREAVDLLNKKHNIFKEDSIHKQLNSKQQNEKKRWYKDNIYVSAPPFLRAFAYFIFRFFFQLGFLDGRPGVIWHFLQAFWYRFLVDAKITQIEYLAKTTNRTIREVLEQDFQFKL
jgi:glycosyltransferase involved in cell wall biosynthesis